MIALDTVQLDSGKETITCLRTELQSKSSSAGDNDSTIASHKGPDELEELKERIQQVLMQAKLRWIG